MGEHATEPDAVERLLRAGPPGETVEELELLADLEASMFGRHREPVTLSRYVVLHRIAAGGAGIVYAAYDPELDRKVAIKLVAARPRHSSSGASTRAALLREAQVLARLVHPNVITVYDVGTYDERAAERLRLGEVQTVPERGLFMVMELVDGEDLARWLRHRRRRWQDVVDMFIAAGRGLAAAHRAGIVHRDFKPANVLVGEDGRVRVLDFGIARAPASDTLPVGGEIDEPEGIVGTPAYMSPEQHAGVEADARADQFAFFVSLWEGLHGELPFPERGSPALARAKRSGPPPVRVRLPGWLRRTLERGLAPRAEDRFASMDEALSRLDRGRRGARRRTQIVVGTFALAAIALVATRQDDPRDECAAASVLGLWDADTEAAVRASFTATGRPFAAAAAAQVDRALARWSRDWTDARIAACLARPAATATTACLERQRVRVGLLVELLHDADASMVERSVDAVASLPPVVECSLAGARDSAPTAAEDTVELELARAEALLHAGRVHEALSVANEAASQAESAPMRARTLLALGSIAIEAGDGIAAERDLDRALQEAERVGENDIAARALIELASAASRLGGRHAEAERLATWADARLAHRGKSDALDVRLALELGALRKNLGRHAHARATLERARVLATEVYGVEHPRVADAENELANVLDLEGRWSEAHEGYRRALDVRLAAFGPEHPKVAAVRNNLGNVLGSLGRREEALVEYTEALRVYEAVLGAEHPGVSAVRNNLAVLAVASGRLEEGLHHHELVLAERRERLSAEHPLVALSENNVGATLEALGRRDEALMHYRRALAIRERGLGPEHPDVAISLNNVGTALAGSDRADEALEYHRRALAIREQVLGPEHPDVATSLVNVGLTLLQLDQREEATRALQRARALRVARVAANDPSVAAIDAALARAGEP